MKRSGKHLLSASLMGYILGSDKSVLTTVCQSDDIADTV